MTDIRLLIPGWPAPVRRPAPGPTEAARRARRHDERECARLAGQLEAVEQDIRTARAGLRRAGGGLNMHHRAAPPAVALRGERVRLPDGAEIVIRAVERADAPLLAEGFDRLSAVSRYRRFLGPVDHLAERECEALTLVDHDRHEALCAIDAVTGHGVGIARYVRDPGDPSLAHVAVTVTDEWRHRGVGRALAERLARRAREAGVDRFSGRMLLGDDHAERLLDGLGERLWTLRGDGTVRITVRLPQTCIRPRSSA